MSAAEFVSSAVAVSDPSSSTTTGSIELPSVAPGDLMLLRISARSVKSIPTAALGVDQDGWVYVTGQASLVGNADVVYSKVCAGESAGDAVTFGLSNGIDAMRWHATVVVYRGFGEDLLVAQTARTDNNDGVAPSVTAGAVPGRLVCFWASQISSQYTTDGWTPAGATITRVRHVNPSTSPGGVFKFTVLVADAEIEVAGPTATLAAGQSHKFTFESPLPPSLEPTISIYIAGGGLGPARIRSHVSEDAGSLFQATQAVAVESAVSEAFPYETTVPSSLYAFREALTPEIVALRYYPIPTRNQEMLTTFEGETNLGRLASTYPASYVRSAGTFLEAVNGTVTAQEAIKRVVAEWESEFDWLNFESIPDLRILVPEAVSAPRQHYIDNPNAGILRTGAIVIDQDSEDSGGRRSMRTILDEWLAIFTGTTIRQTSSGTIELVPRVGPDAPDDASVDVAWRDIISMSDGEDDPRGVINRARVTSNGWDFSSSPATVLPDLYVLRERSDGLNAGVLEGESLLPSAEPLTSGAEREFSLVVDPSESIDFDVTLKVYVSANQTGNPSVSEEASVNATFTLSGGTHVETFFWTIFNSETIHTSAHFTRTLTGVKIDLRANRFQFGPNVFVGMRYAAYVLIVNDATATAWTKTEAPVTAEFGQSTDSLPADGGGDALAASRATYGERLETINSTVFQLSPEQAMQVAMGYVLHNINPRTIREVQQSEWNKYPVKFDHIGRLVDLPNGERAVVENRSYSDSFAPGGGAMQSTFTATVTDVILDTTTQYLFMDDGSYMLLDDGSIAEEQ